jgi:hypothetical protein
VRFKFGFLLFFELSFFVQSNFIESIHSFAHSHVHTHMLISLMYPQASLCAVRSQIKLFFLIPIFWHQHKKCEHSLADFTNTHETHTHMCVFVRLFSSSCFSWKLILIIHILCATMEIIHLQENHHNNNNN